jgi:hypothetical protein
MGPAESLRDTSGAYSRRCREHRFRLRGAPILVPLRGRLDRVLQDAVRRIGPAEHRKTAFSVTTPKAAACALAPYAGHRAHIVAALFPAPVYASAFIKLASCATAGFPDVVCGMRPANADVSGIGVVPTSVAPLPAAQRFLRLLGRSDRRRR